MNDRLTLISLVLGTALAVLLTAGPIVFAGPTEPGLVAWWTFDEDSGDIARDMTGHGHDGKILGATRVKGDFGSALWFHGKEAVRVEDAPDLQITEALTLEAWVAPDEMLPREDSAYHDKIICKVRPARKGEAGDGRGHHGYFLDHTGNRFSLCIHAAHRPLGFRVYSPLATQNEKWYHVVATYNGGETKIYVDGEYDPLRRVQTGRRAQCAKSIGPTDDVPLWIGAFAGPASYGWYGLIDEVRIYNRALKPEEIKAHYQEGKAKHTGSATVRTVSLIIQQVTLRPGRKSHIAVTLINNRNQAVQGIVQYQITDLRDTIRGQGKLPRLRIPAWKQVQIKVPYRPGQRGVQRLTCWWEDEKELARSELIVVVPPPSHKTPQVRPSLTLKLLDEVDCTAHLPAEKYCEAGATKIVQSPVGAYREAGSNQSDRFAVRFHVEKVLVPHLMVVEYPDDKPRTMDIIAIFKDAQPNWEINTGVLTGMDFPLTNKFHKHRCIFWPRSNDFALVLMTWRKNRPAAVRRIWLYEITGGLPKLEVNTPKGAEQRMIGHQWEDMSMYSAWGGRQALTRSERILRLLDIFSHMIDYFEYTGQNLFKYPCCFYWGPTYPSSTENPWAATAGGVLGNLGQADWARILLTMFEDHGMYYVPSMTIVRLPSLMAIRNHDEEAVRAGADTVNMCLSNNGVQAGPGPCWLSSGSTSLGPEERYEVGPTFDPIHPQVRKALLAVIQDAVKRYGHSPAFKGISLNVWQTNIVWMNNLKYGYGDQTIRQFEQETGIKIPVGHGDRERFKKRAEWLLANRKEAWINWRCQKIGELYLAMRDILRKRRPDLSLTISCWLWYNMLGHHRRDEWLSGPWRKMRPADAVYQIYREGGIDLEALRGQPGIRLELQCAPQHYRNKEQEPLAYAWIRALEMDPGVQALFDNAGNTSTWFWSEYCEHIMPQPKPLPGFWWDQRIKSASAITPAHKYFMEHYANILAGINPTRITCGGTQNSTMGHEEQIQRFAQAFRALPVGDFVRLPGQTDPVTIRTMRAGKQVYVCLVNKAHYQVGLEMTLRAKGRKDPWAVDLVTGRPLPPIRRGDQEVLLIALEPYELKSLALTPASAQIASAQAIITRRQIEELGEVVDRVRNLISEAQKASADVSDAQKILQEMEAALASRTYSRLHQLSLSFYIRELEQYLAERKQQ